MGQLFKNVSSQKVRVFAFADAGHASLDAGEPVTGDAANISARVSVDNAALGASNDTAPSEIDATNAPGFYEFDATQAETNGDVIEWYPKSSTAGVQVVTVGGNVQTTQPPNFPDLGIESDGDLTKVNTCDTNTDMRGTDSAYTGTPPTAGQNASAVWTTDFSASYTANEAAQYVKEIRTDTETTIPATLGTPAGADLSTDIAAVKTDTGNLVTRITSTLFSGITSLAEWLGAMAGKQTANSTARTEIRATGAGSGTFDETTESLEALRDHIGDGTNLTEAGGTGDQLTAVPWNAAWDAEVQSEVQDAIEANNLDHLLAVADADDVADDSVIAKLAASDGDWSGFDNSTESLEALRDRGDAAWTTGGGGSISDIINVQPLIPHSIDVANTASWRIGLMLFNALDDLPSTAEITPGTISIERKAAGGTSWSAIVTDAACSELAGLIYYDEVFSSGSGYAEDDSIRITFKSQKVTVSANDYEIIDSNGRRFYTYIRGPIALDAAATRTAIGLASANLDSQFSGLNDLDAAGVRSAVGLASANLDSQFSGLNDLDAAGVRSAVGLASANLDTQLGDIDSDTSTLVSRITTNLFTGITSLANWLRLMTRSDAAIVTDAATAASEINDDLGSGAGNYNSAADSLEALRDRGDAAWTTGAGGSAPTASEVADAVWDEALSGHTTSGTAGERLGRVPNAAAGGSGGLPTVDGSNYVAGIQGTANTLDDLNDPTAAAIAAAILAAGDVDGYSVEETLKLCLAALAGKLSGAATATVTIRAADDSKARITATVDANGNRSAVTLDAAG